MKIGKNKYSTSSSSKKKGKINWKLISVAVGSALIVICVYQFGVLKIVKEQERNATINQMTESNYSYVKTYVLNKKNGLKQGDEITPADLKELIVSSAAVPANAIKTPDQVNGQVVRMNLAQKTTITEDMIEKKDDKITNGTKNQDYDWIKVHAFLKQGQYVDIHYKKPDGTDYIVVAKKRITALSRNIFSVNITEKERAYINNATVAASLIKGTLYTSIYPDPENQTTAEVTYPLDTNISTMIAKDPNVVKDAAETLKSNNKSDSNKNTITEEKPSFAEGGNK